MPSQRFSPFERIMITRQRPLETAWWLILGWILRQRTSTESADSLQQRLSRLTRTDAWDPALAKVLEIAKAPSLDDIQLACEQMAASEQAGMPWLSQAIHAANEGGHLSLPNQQILYLLADLLKVSPAGLAEQFETIAETPIQGYEDISTANYWQRHEPERERQRLYEAQARQASDAHAQQQAEDRVRRQQTRDQAHREARERKRQQAAAQAQARREKKRRDKAQSPHARHQQTSSNQHSRHRQHQDDSRFSHTSQHKPHRPRLSGRKVRALMVLGLREGASQEDIRQAYRRLAQRHHPDRHGHSARQMALASARFQRIKDAYDDLMKPGH